MLDGRRFPRDVGSTDALAVIALLALRFGAAAVRNDHHPATQFTPFAGWAGPSRKLARWEAAATVKDAPFLGASLNDIAFATQRTFNANAGE